MSSFSTNEFSEFLASRRTTRDFLPTPVAPELIEQLLTDAMTAPSWSNTRPFLVAVAAGATRDRISAEFCARWDAVVAAKQPGWAGFKAKVKLVVTRYGLPDSDYRVYRPYPPELKARARRVGAALYQALGVARDDRPARDAQWRRNYEFFGAPVSLFVFTHSGLGEYSVSDAGLMMQNLMLSAHAHGLGSCAQGASALWAKPVRAEFKVPKQYKLLCGIAIGYPSDAPVNRFQAERLPVSVIELLPNSGT